MTGFEQQVRERAYFIWEDEGRIFGRADQHWLRAETELRAQAPADLLLVQAAPPALTLAASPSEVLTGKPGRTRAAAAKVEAKAETSAAKASAPKAAASKTAASKSTASKSTASKSAASKSATAKAVAKAETAPKAAKAPRASARPRTAEITATVH